MKEKRIVLSFDGGFSRMKVMAMDVTGRAASDIHLDGIWKHMDRSVFAPLPRDVTNVIAVVDAGDGISGLTGEDAPLLQPTLWQSDSTEAHYGSPAQKLFVRSAMLRSLLGLNISSGAVGVHLSLSLAGMHSFYADMIRAAMSESFKLVASSGEQWQIKVLSCEVKTQPFWLAVDVLSQWDTRHGTLRPFNAAPIMAAHYPVFLDFGSLTFQGAGFARNLNAPPVKWCERLGTWEQVRDDLKMRLQKKAGEQHLQLFDPTMQELLTCYETGVFVRGKHHLDMHEEIDEMVRPKVEQRLRIAEQQLHGGASVGEMYLSGGDVERNLPMFAAYYQERISGAVQIMKDEHGQDEPLWRIASGGLKGALRQYLGGLK